MNKIKALLAAIVFVLSVASVCDAINVIYVDVNGPNDPGSGSYTDPFRRIQDAIDAANNDDIIEIRPGIYTGAGNYDLDPNDKSISVRSVNPDDAGVVANTIIDPNNAGRGFYIHDGEDANRIISGLTIRNAYTTTEYDGAGIYCFNGSLTVHNCVIQDGYAEGSGGGICCNSSIVTIINCTITGNTADYYGGGISCVFCAPLITGCTISNNTASREGGGIDSGESDPNILNCIIFGNNSIVGGGINCYFRGSANLVNCTIAANSADNVGGGVYCWTKGSVTIENSILWANWSIDGAQLGLEEEGTASVSYCDIQGGQTGIYNPCGLLVWGAGNINNDPCFASFDPNGNPDLWDFHLQSEYGRWKPDSQSWVIDSNTSPCIDAGDTNSNWTAEPWPNGKRINIGAYGGTNQASKNGNPADFNIDGVVNFQDFALLANKWMVEGSFIEDLNLDGVVEFEDLRLFADNWLWQRE